MCKCRILDSCQVFSGARIHANLVAWLDVERYSDGGARFQNGRFAATGAGVAALVRSSPLLPAQPYWAFPRRSRAPDNFRTVMPSRPSFKNSAGGPMHFVKLDLLVADCVHHGEFVACLIQIVHFRLLDNGGRYFFTGAESLFQGIAGFHVLHLGANESRALARLHVHGFDYLPNAVVVFNCHTRSKIIDWKSCGIQACARGKG